MKERRDLLRWFVQLSFRQKLGWKMSLRRRRQRHHRCCRRHCCRRCRPCLRRRQERLERNQANAQRCFISHCQASSHESLEGFFCLFTSTVRLNKAAAKVKAQSRRPVFLCLLLLALFILSKKSLFHYMIEVKVAWSKVSQSQNKVTYTVLSYIDYSVSHQLGYL